MTVRLPLFLSLLLAPAALHAQEGGEPDAPADGSGQPPADGRPTGIQFVGVSNNTELGNEDVPASVYIAAAGSAPRLISIAVFAPKPAFNAPRARMGT